MARGRPRAFDKEKALETAMRLFWRHGYEGTSVAMLCKDMAINMPSLYAAFGNKEALFKQAIDLYIQNHACYIRRALAAPTAREAAEQLFRGAIDMVDDPNNPDGCMIVHGALVATPLSDSVREVLIQRRNMAESLIRQRFEHAVATGDLPPTADAAKLARFIITVNWGNAVQSASGAERAQLEMVAEMAMRGWDCMIAAPKSS